MKRNINYNYYFLLICKSNLCQVMDKGTASSILARYHHKEVEGSAESGGGS